MRSTTSWTGLQRFSALALLAGGCAPGLDPSFFSDASPEAGAPASDARGSSVPDASAGLDGASRPIDAGPRLDAPASAPDAFARTDAGGRGDAGMPPPSATGPRVGLWMSPWQLHRRSPEQWVQNILGASYATSRRNQAIVVISICGAGEGDISVCRFPRPSGIPAYPHVVFEGRDLVTPILDAIDRNGEIDVILDVEPMRAHVSDLMNVAMTTFGRRPSVVGFTPDWEWIRGDGDRGAQLEGWVRELHGYRAGLEFHLIAWETEVFGPYRHEVMSFGYDGQNVDPLRMSTPETSFAALRRLFQGWSDAFRSYGTGWYWGYDSDAWWMTRLVRDARSLRDVQDQILAIDPEGTLLLATEEAFFGVFETLLPSAPMWE